TEPNVNRVAKVTANGVVSEFLVPGAAPRSIAVGDDQNVWFTEPGTRSIGRLIPATGAVQHFSAGITGAPGDIARGPDMALWFTEPDAQMIGRIDLDGNVTEYVSGSTGKPTSIAKGPDG